MVGFQEELEVQRLSAQGNGSSQGSGSLRLGFSLTEPRAWELVSAKCLLHSQVTPVIRVRGLKQSHREFGPIPYLLLSSET